jgi:uncharacterized membrane protein
VLPIHIAAGGLAILLGFTALAARKGSATHRQVGLLFVYAMIVMGVSASILGIRKSWTDPNVFAAFMTAYFVITGLTAVRPPSNQTRTLNIIALVIAIGLSSLDFLGGIQAYQAPRHMLNGVPAFMLFFLSAVLASAAIGDVRLMRSGPLKGAPRLRRHLWRLLFALFIAAGSFFSIKARVAKVFPEALTGPAFRVLPILVIFGAMFYWLWRLRGKRPIPQRS